jgi:2-methylaconitate isomerase
MPHDSIRAVYMRGGTSRALFFHKSDLPPASPPDDCGRWNEIFCGALGTPDPHRRQLDGMGGGISSLSKIAVIGPPSRPDADVDYTFAQVAIDDAVVSYRGNCGNISSAVGPYAVDEGIVPAAGASACVRIHNTNTGKIIVAEFALEDGRAAVDGDFELQGVAGVAAPVRLSFLDPGGAVTGRLLPTGSPRDTLRVADLGPVEVSLVDAANPVVFLSASAVGLSGFESPSAVMDDARAMRCLEDIRVAASVAMGVTVGEATARTRVRNLPLVALLAEGATQADADVATMMISAGQPHKATPLTGAMCLAAAAEIPGTVVAQRVPGRAPGSDFRIRHPSGVMPVAADVSVVDGQVRVNSVVVYRTARRLMEGVVYYRKGVRSPRTSDLAAALSE